MLLLYASVLYVLMLETFLMPEDASMMCFEYLQPALRSLENIRAPYTGAWREPEYQYGTRAVEHRVLQCWTHVRLCVSLTNTRVCFNLERWHFFNIY